MVDQPCPFTKKPKTTSKINIMKSNNHTTNLTFAALIRVSTEQQARAGESLRTQRKQIEEAVQSLNGRIVGWYGGQEHATPGFEKKEIDRLFMDASRQNRPFNAVIVVHPDRWSRDNEKSMEGLRNFRDNGIRFFIRESEQDLFDESCRMYLGISAVVGEYQASRQTRASLENRIHRARRGIPTCGKLPFGRTYDPVKGWGVDERLRDLIVDAAKRYIAGERLTDIARENKLNHSNLHKVLTCRSGTQWQQTFNSKRLKISQVVDTIVPPLLPDDMITAIKMRADKNRTFKRGRRANGSPYLLGRYIFCAHCGYTLSGQRNHGKHLFYRHSSQPRIRKCTCAKSWVRAEELERRVMNELFIGLGNPVAVQQAIVNATPSIERRKESEEHAKILRRKLAKNENARQDILDLIGDRTLSKEEAKKKLDTLKVEHAELNEKLATLYSYLDNLPTPEAFKRVATIVSKKFGTARCPSAVEVKLNATIRLLKHDMDLMTWADKRGLIEMLFDGKMPDGRKCGVYVRWPHSETDSSKPKWRYTICGVLYDTETGVKGEAVVKYASHSPNKSPPEFRSPANTPPPPP